MKICLGLRSVLVTSFKLIWLEFGKLYVKLYSTNLLLAVHTTWFVLVILLTMFYLENSLQNHRTEIYGFVLVSLGVLNQKEYTPFK